MAAPREENRPRNSRRFIEPSIITSTRSVLLSAAHGLPLKNFARDYKALVKSDFPFRQCGYSSAVEMLRDMEQDGAVRFAEGKDGIQLYGVGDKGCFMPSWVKKAQVVQPATDSQQQRSRHERTRGGRGTRRLSGNSDRRPGPRNYPRQQQNTTADPFDLQFDFNGLVSLFVFWRYTSHDVSPPSIGNMSDQQISEKRAFLYQLMSRAGKPAQIIVQKKGYGFVKFSTIEAARRALDMYNGTVIDGVEYVMKSGYSKQRDVAVSSRERNSDSRSSGQDSSWRTPDTVPNQAPGSRTQPISRTAPIYLDFPSPPPSHRHTITSRQRHHSSFSTSYDDVIVNDVTPNEMTSTHSLSLNSLESDRSLLNGVECRSYSQNFQDSSYVVESGEDEWSDSLLPPVSEFVFCSSDEDGSLLHRMLTACSGGLDWTDRISSVGGDCVRVKVLEATSACHCWIQLVDSCELACLVAVERYLRQSPPLSCPHSSCHRVDSVCGVIVRNGHQDTADIARCWVPPSTPHTSNQSCEHVFLIDRGVWITTDSQNLFSIPQFASTLPLQAIPCVLKDLKLFSAYKSDIKKGAGLLRALTQDEVFTVTLTTPTQVTSIPEISFSTSTNIVKTITSSSFAYCTQQTTETLSRAHQTPPTLGQTTPTLNHTPSLSHARQTPRSLYRTTPTLKHALPESHVQQTIPSLSQNHNTTPPQHSHHHKATPSSISADPDNSNQSITTFGNRLSISSEDSHLDSEGWGRSPGAQGITTSAICVPNENGLTCVTVSEVVSPNLLWLQLSSDPCSDLDNISSSIAASLDPTPPQQVCVGQLYSVLLAEKYFRVRVESVKTNHLSQQVISVLCVDTGILHTVALHQLSCIPPPLSLSLLPSLALPCHLHGLVSTREDGKWWKLDNQWLWQNLRNKKVYAYFVSSPVVPPSSSSSVASSLMPSTPVHLYFDGNGWDSVGDTLVSEGTNVGYLPGVGVRSP